MTEKCGQCRVALDNGWARLLVGDSRTWSGKADFVFTNPYAPLPDCLRDKPAIVSFYRDRDTRLGWVDGPLTKVGEWGTGKNAVYVARLEPKQFDLSDLWEEGDVFCPLEYPLRLLRHFGKPGMTVWDGFMGRGTTGKACHMLSMKFIGIDIDAKRIEQAKSYLGVL